MRCTLVALALFGCAAVVLAAPLSEDDLKKFDDFRNDQGKEYKNDLDALIHEAAFENNLKKIDQDNTAHPGWQEGETDNTDKTHSELKHERLGVIVDNGTAPAPAARQAPSSLDWRSKMTPVKNQGSCGSCWAFSAIAVLESRLIIKNKMASTGDLSEQQLVDCAKTYGNMGCEGGVPGWAFNYIKDKQSISTEAKYPYITDENSYCLAPSTGLQSVLFAQPTVAYKTVARGSDADMIAALQSGPVCACIGVDANPGFYNYKSGVFDCTTKVTQSLIDHAIVVVGYTPSTWIIRNSWGPNWGNKGYAEVKRIGDPCGILLQAQYPLL